MLAILFYHSSFFFFSNTDSCFLINAFIAQSFNPIAELVITIGTGSKEAKAEIEIYPVIAEAKISVYYNLELYKPFYAVFLQENNFLFHPYF